MPTPPRRPRGRPVGGGNTAEQARTVLLDAAERTFIDRGARAATMEAIAAEAGYSRTAAYRQFPTRRELIAALVQRTTQRHMSSILQRLPDGAGPLDILMESLVIVASELVRDPLLRTVAEQSPDGTVASLILDDSDLTATVQSVMGELMAQDPGLFRPGLHPQDVAQFVIAVAMSFLTEVVPAVQDPAVARAYLNTFVLPAIIAKPSAPERVFPDADAP